MRGADIEDHPDRRLGDVRQCGDIAGVAGRHLQNQVIGAAGGPQHRPRVTQLVVEGSGRGHHLAQRLQHGGHQVFGGGFARRAGDPDDGQPARHQFGGHRPGQLGERGQHRRARSVGIVLEHSCPDIRCGRRGPSYQDGGHADRSRRQHGDGAGRHRRRRVVVPIGAGAGQCQEQATGSDGPRVEFHGPGDAALRGVRRRDVGQGTADDLGDLGDRQVDHPDAPSASKASASSTRSSNGRTSAPAR